MIKKINNFFSFTLFAVIAVAFLSAFVLARPAFGESCPNNTTVTGTNVTFAGDLTGTGGDSSILVWFQYGLTQSYGQTAPQISVSQAGLYCITVSGLTPCTTYHYRAAAQNSAGTSYGEDKSFTTSCTSPYLNLQANGSEGPITVSSGSSVSLSWTSGNANSCTASGGWSGSRAVSGSETITNITSSKTFTLTCSDGGGTISDSVTVNVGQITSVLTVNKLVRNLSDGTAFADSVYANPSEVLTFSVAIQAGNSSVQNVIIKDTLPANVTWRSNSLKLDGNSIGGDVIAGVNIGDLSAYQTKTVTFDADLAGSNSFSYGNTQLTNSVLVYNSQTSALDTAQITVTKTAVAGAATGTATAVSTGWTDNIFLDSVIIPLAIALVLIFIFKSHIFKLEEWFESRKKEYQKFRSDKVLRMRITKTKIQEALTKVNLQKALAKRIG